MPALRAFCSDHPNVRVNVLAESGLSRLELGQADIAVRTGPKPNNPDYVVVPFQQLPLRLFGHRNYFERAEVPRSPKELKAHSLIGTKSASGAIDICDLFGARKETLTMVTNDPSITLCAVESGMGLGVLYEPEIFPQLVDVFPDTNECKTDVWLVTHVDLHRTMVLQTVLRYLRTPI